MTGALQLVSWHGLTVTHEDEKQIVTPSERLLVELRRLEWVKGLSEETLTAITNKAERVEFHSGEVVIEVGSEITHVYFLITGRMQARIYDTIGKETLQHVFVRGSVVGLFSLADRSCYQLQAT